MCSFLSSLGIFESAVLLKNFSSCQASQDGERDFGFEDLDCANVEGRASGGPRGSLETFMERG